MAEQTVVTRRTTVTRFVIRDMTGVAIYTYDNNGVKTSSAAEFTFPINPTDYSPLEEENFQSSNEAISGHRKFVKFNRPATSQPISFQSINRGFYLTLKELNERGNIYFMLDHHKNGYIGKIVDFRVKEILATVPSRYEVSFLFKGVGRA